MDQPTPSTAPAIPIESAAAFGESLTQRDYLRGCSTTAACWYLSGLIAAGGFAFGFYLVRHAGYGGASETHAIDAVVHFDGRWYREIATQGYDYNPNHRSSVAFFPVYPLLTRAVIHVTGLSAELALLCVSNCSFLLALCLLGWYATSNRLPPYSRACLGECTITAAALFPTSFFFRLAYSESTFLLLAVAAMLSFARRWPLWSSSLIVGLATATRPVGVALLGPLLINICRRRATPARRLLRLAIYLIVGSWGVLAYMTYQYVAFDDPFVFVRTQRYWSTVAELPWTEKFLELLALAPIRAVYDPRAAAFWARIDNHGVSWLSLQFANPLFLIAAVSLVSLGTYRRWLSLEEATLCTLLLIIPYIGRGYEMGLASMGRFAAVAFPIYIVMGRFLAVLPDGVRCTSTAVSGLLMAAYSAQFAAGYQII